MLEIWTGLGIALTAYFIVTDAPPWIIALSVIIDAYNIVAVVRGSR